MIPSSINFRDEVLHNHPALKHNFSEPGRTIGHMYRNTLKEQIDSLKICINDSTAFHLDGLVQSLMTSENLFEDASDLLGTVPTSDGNLSYDAFEYLVRKFSKPGFPSIDPNKMNANFLLNSAREFRENNDIIYVDGIFDDVTFAAIEREVARIWKSPDLEPNCNLDGENRIGGYVHLASGLPVSQQKDSLYNLIYANEPLRLWISAITGQNVFASDFPIELREYGNQSAGMQCHSDVQMYADERKNFEVVVTVSNHGKSDLHWFDRRMNEKVIRSRPNSITVVRPNAAVHCVGEAGGGFREILKFIYVGTYRKHANFFRYVRNKCSNKNPNVKSVKSRRFEVRQSNSAHQADKGDLSISDQVMDEL